MNKATIARIFIGSMAAVAAGAVLAVAAVWTAIEQDVFRMSGPDIVGLAGGPVSTILLGLAIVGGLAVAGGMIGGLVAWIGALLNTSRLESKAWLLGLLLLGIFNLGFLAMIAYLVAGPDGTATTRSRTAPVPATA